MWQFGEAVRGMRGPAGSRVKIRLERTPGKPFEVELGGDELGLLGEPLSLREDAAVLGDQGVAVPGEIGGGLAGARSRVQVRGEAAGGLAGDEIVAVPGEFG